MPASPTKEVAAVFKALKWAFQDDVVTKLEVATDLDFHFLLAHGETPLREMIAKMWPEASMMTINKLVCLSKYYQTHCANDKWVADLNPNSFNKFVVALTATKAYDSDDDDTPTEEDATEPEDFHDETLRKAGMTGELLHSLQRNRHYNISRHEVLADDSDLRIWRDLKFKLTSHDPTAILKWYKMLEHEASLIYVHLCPLDKFQHNHALFPASYTPKEIFSMNNILSRKLTEDDINQDDATLRMFFQAYLGASQSKLSAYRFLHDVVSYAVRSVEDNLHSMPVYDPAASLTEFSTALMQYQEHENLVYQRQVANVELSRQFLKQISEHGFPTSHLLTELNNLKRGTALPTHLTVTQLAVRFPQDSAGISEHSPVIHRVNTRGYGNSKSSTVPTESSMQNPARAKADSPFYKPVKNAICKACLRPGHNVTSCLFLARHVMLTEYATEHSNEAAALLAQFKQHFSSSNRRAVARGLYRGQGIDANDVIMSDEVDQALYEDFCNAGQE
mmetsp:Transcript_12630/g.36755  ORF Transcript_12630/g.36755 Transcript_12630/m.36755 type:complete len:506 (+) Transcript_12630:249-1766(+)